MNIKEFADFLESYLVINKLDNTDIEFDRGYKENKYHFNQTIVSKIFSIFGEISYNEKSADICFICNGHLETLKKMCFKIQEVFENKIYFISTIRIGEYKGFRVESSFEVVKDIFLLYEKGDFF